MYVKIFKYEFWLRSVALMGHIISRHGVRVNIQRIEAKRIFPTSTSPTDKRSFFGLAHYYRRFVEGFSYIFSPLTKFTQKIGKFSIAWSFWEKFWRIEKEVDYLPVLTLSEGTEGFLAYYDSPWVYFGCVLMKYGEVIGYDYTTQGQWEELCIS